MWDQDGSRILSHWSTRNVAPIPGPLGWRGNRLEIFTGNPRVLKESRLVYVQYQTQSLVAHLNLLDDSTTVISQMLVAYMFISIIFIILGISGSQPTNQTCLFFRACSLGCFCSIAPPLLIPATSVRIPVADSWSTIKHQVSHQQHRPLDNTCVDTTPWIYIYTTTYITICIYITIYIYITAVW